MVTSGNGINWNRVRVGMYLTAKFLFKNRYVANMSEMLILELGDSGKYKCVSLFSVFLCLKFFAFF